MWARRTFLGALYGCTVAGASARHKDLLEALGQIRPDWKGATLPSHSNRVFRHTYKQLQQHRVQQRQARNNHRSF